MSILFVSLLCLLLVTHGQEIATACSSQLFNLYRANGMSITENLLPVIDYTTGYLSPGNISFVTATIKFQSTAAFYRARITTPNTLANPPTVAYVSIDVPLCVTEITVTCSNVTELGMTNKTSCTNIVDYDTGFPSLLAGRLYIYTADPVYAGCGGSVSVTFKNAYLPSNAQLSTRYVYDIGNILNTSIPPTNQSTAHEQYRTRGCLYSDGFDTTFATTQRQFACVDQTIACLALNTVVAVAPPDFSVKLRPCNSTLPSTCVPLNGSASYQTGNAQLYYRWEAKIGSPLSPPIYDNVTCNDYTSGLFNAMQPVACAVFKIPGLYMFNLTVYDNSTSISYDTVYVNVVPSDAPLVLPNETSSFAPPPPLRTDPPINRPVISFPPSVPPPPITESPLAPFTPIDTNVSSLVQQWPPLTPVETLSVFAILCANLIIFVIFVGLWIALMPGDETNYLDRIRYAYDDVD